MAKLTDGSEIYPHRSDLASLPFWKCVMCNNYVGCHHKTGNPTKPLGNIPTEEMRKWRSRIHAILDPLWKRGELDRKSIYALISKRIGRKYHTAEIRTVEEAIKVHEIIAEIERRIQATH